MSWIGELLNDRTARAFLAISFMFTLFFLWATITNSTDFVTNIASFSATMMGVGTAGFLTFYLIDKESKRRQKLRTAWYYHFIRRIAGILLVDINFYIFSGFRNLGFGDYPLMSRLASLVVVGTAERTLNIDAIDISSLLRETRESLFYMNERINNRRRMGLWPNDLDLMSGLSRSTLNTLFPIISEFRINVLNPAARDLEDPEVINALFRCRDSFDAFSMMYSNSGWLLNHEFSQNLLIFFDSYTGVYKILKKYASAT